MATQIVTTLIKLYQKTFSPDHGAFRNVSGFSRCRFYPSCSEYTKEAVSQYGLFKGAVVSLRRIIRCNPFHHGGYDPLK
ncbi:MAG: membrane protein insertion efficiency factor YidD [Candidatus Sungbacteria bacterium RIFCSPLOWO2_01_FULL_47_10]|uniref:Putative membrane protein insertion efficiency factor n=1 Tax=Candidatus Sungbacteria bacterium RIFCSPLOWO2_01_FULL_47_10 TaxID=1802276 RepID=A0A1G2L9X5_9BACT|nr:MAG: membrane protein insertion efficiency factor YidD [Candidatus Sungbacteria bacterium RIFCSPLOWO2_01_FULL_47_10]